ncbi:hypothetical protein H5410_032443 [Solanum commersonii]|uniref:Terpene synthase metal-binding domain-containing protein n=1 Tax=Solanum commersonii TaxID=4109 RepID=A0A9J5YL33_SOLCO|nr:hypothetical protein H5410_032443 [Solanum commersonii]
MSSIIDETYDAYGTLDELAPFTDAIQTWDISAIDSIAPYLRLAYEGLLDVYSEMEQVLAKECKSDHEEVGECLFKEAQWLDAGYIRNVKSTWRMHLASSMICRAMDDIIGHEVSITSQGQVTLLKNC